jgi:hypothetical protein
VLCADGQLNSRPWSTSNQSGFNPLLPDCDRVAVGHSAGPLCESGKNTLLAQIDAADPLAGNLWLREASHAKELLFPCNRATIIRKHSKGRTKPSKGRHLVWVAVDTVAHGSAISDDIGTIQAPMFEQNTSHSVRSVEVTQRWGGVEAPSPFKCCRVPSTGLSPPRACRPAMVNERPEARPDSKLLDLVYLIALSTLPLFISLDIPQGPPAVVTDERTENFVTPRPQNRCVPTPHTSFTQQNSAFMT